MPLDPVIIQAFHQSGLTQRELAHRLGVRQPTVSDWLNGKKSPHARNIEKLRAALGLTQDETPPLGASNDQITLIIYNQVRPSAGDGHIIYAVDATDAEHIDYNRRIFHDLLGFYPPENMRGVYVQGHSMAPGISDGQLVLYQPADHLTTGQRYILLIEDIQTGDWPLYIKRIQTFVGGGLKIISDNPGLGIEDEKLIPDQRKGEGLFHEATGLPIRIRVVGHVLWPLDNEAADHVRLITRTIERLTSMGLTTSRKRTV